MRSLARLTLAFGLLPLLHGIAAAASPGTLLHSFTGPEGAQPGGELIRDAAGALYGEAELGGSANSGTVFKLTPPSAGQPSAGQPSARQTQWQTSVLHVFKGPPGDGIYPSGGLAMDEHGNLFGTTQYGPRPQAYGTVFELSPPAPGLTKWTEQILHVFVAVQNGADCYLPTSGVIRDSAGVLYGTGSNGGPGLGGCVFKLTPPPPGGTAWTETVLQSFSNTTGAPGGSYPFGGLAIDGAGTLYGTTELGGGANIGTVYALTPPAAGQTAWSETVLHSFARGALDGALPNSTPILDAAGAIYGVTLNGGGDPSGLGAIFRLTPPAAGQTGWSETILHSFNGTDGTGSFGRLLMDATGALYQTGSGGAANMGTITRLAPTAGAGPRPESVLHSFTGGADGASPQGGLIVDPAGNFYGTAAQGGQPCPAQTGGCGTVFSFSLR